ncbi:hypothetical protein EXN66_Car008324 [Channa argus]|uniref:Uncharacterized protein n=1 Tax=Channa argus TaxID=215402 RepID=A0A6G1PRN5_CHAAH|nr:hypothetical protein EXN66_Car008324 [Channa argus]
MVCTLLLSASEMRSFLICVGKKKEGEKFVTVDLRLRDDSKKMIFPKPSLKLYANL